MSHYDIEPLKGFDPQIGFLLSGLVDSTREWHEYMEDLPEEAIGWTPVPGSYNIGCLLLHLIDCEDYWFRQVIAGETRTKEETDLLMSDDVDQESHVWPTPPDKPLSWYFDLHKQVRARAFECLKGQAPNRWIEHHRDVLTVRWIVAHVLEHDSYTGGQAVALSEMWKKANGK